LAKKNENLMEYKKVIFLIEYMINKGGYTGYTWLHLVTLEAIPQ